MVPHLRQAFNAAWSADRYTDFLKDLNSRHPGAIEFRIAETPVFVPRDFGALLTTACDSIIDLITDPGFKQLTERSIPPADRVANENDHPHMLVFDFAVCENAEGSLEPQLIEMQGFPSLYGFQADYPDLLRRYFPVPDNYSQYLGGYDRESYLAALEKVILGGLPAENVILLELKPHQQKTRIDFYCTQDQLGIQPVCLTELVLQGRKLYYHHAVTGRLTEIKRIYNRVIFDELHAYAPTASGFPDIRQDLDVQWIPHPN